MSMNEFLAQSYGTLDPLPTPTQEDQAKLAQFELFAKVAADQNIDLNKLSDQEVLGLFSTFQAKLAEETKKEEEAKKQPSQDSSDEQKEKEAAAQAELEAIKVAQAEFERADMAGRIMAHAYVNEMKKIAAAQGAETAPQNAAPSTSSDTGRFAKIGAALKATQPPQEPAKVASALDELAAETAVKLAAEASMDPEHIGGLLDQLFTSGKVASSTKVASARNMDEAREIRALELLEQVGCQVNWAQ